MREYETGGMREGMRRFEVGMRGFEVGMRGYEWQGNLSHALKGMRIHFPNTAPKNQMLSEIEVAFY